MASIELQFWRLNTFCNNCNSLIFVRNNRNFVTITKSWFFANSFFPPSGSEPNHKVQKWFWAMQPPTDQLRLYFRSKLFNDIPAKKSSRNSDSIFVFRKCHGNALKLT
jgi:hypothetical protein